MLSKGAPAPRQTFTTLNALRGVAAIAVATMHWRVVFGPFHAYSGYLAVDLFFLLSGFVVAFSYDAKLRGAWTAPHFLGMRLVRLYPMYILGVCITLGGIFAFNSGDRMEASLPEIAAAAFCNGLMLPSFSMGQSHAVFPLNTPAWTLFLELACNLAYALLHRFTSVRNLLLCAALSAGALVAIAVEYGTINLGFSTATFFVGLFRVGFSFSAGVLLCRAYRADLLPTWRLPGLCILSICLGALLYQPTVMPLFELFCILFLFPLVIMVSVHSSSHAAISDFLGSVSYPLYAIHMPVLGIILVLFKGQSQPALAMVAFFSLLALVLLSRALDQQVDKPVRAKLSAAWLRNIDRPSGVPRLA
ncbi:acyltransferase family protein [Sphingobium phenoxybenzoativorans]|uniref:acyltransferase family protein n=1 Tax=Sphingobium phenoxybenzoativorans TaxID=1592790 RepID=UPI0014955872|nr:acyltransferase [Sphingobium phenoxybenzoativorans]